MLKTLAKLAFAAALATAVFTLPALADDKTDLLRDANRTVSHLRSDPAFGTARTMLQGAEAVYIVPKLVKGGFIFGAEGGDGVLLKRTGKGWSTPRFYGMGSASFGLQAGLQQAELVFIINSRRALAGIEKGEVKLGAISHIVSFWRYRFPPRMPAKVDAEDLAVIFQDFCSGFGERMHNAEALIKRPKVIDTTAA